MQIDIDPRLRRSPTLSISKYAVFRYSETSGYGLFATETILKETAVLAGAGPEVHVIYRAFRREVCAWCFRYEHGRNWHMRIERDSGGGGGTTGMVFCCETCRECWIAGYGPDGLEAFIAVEELLRRHMRSKDWSSSVDETGDSREPTEQEVEDAWMGVDQKAERIREYRLQAINANETTSTSPHRPSTLERRSERKLQKQAFAEALKLPIHSSDTLFYLLSGILCSNSAGWLGLLSLNPSQPYTSLSLLKEAFAAYLQLLAVLPLPLIMQHTLSRPVLEAILSRDRGNSFGIWSTSPETDTEDPEMMGYGVWTSSSFFNHSCAPSIKKVREGRTWTFTAARDIAIGEECCISYIRGEEDALDVEARRKRLQNGWGFVCACTKCIEETQSTRIIK